VFWLVNLYFEQNGDEPPKDSQKSADLSRYKCLLLVSCGVSLTMYWTVFWDVTPRRLAGIYPEDRNVDSCKTIVNFYETTRRHIPESRSFLKLIFFFFSCSFWFVVFPPVHGNSVTDFWGWDAHEAQLRCPDDVSGDRGRWSSRSALKPKFY
jgi:hypothetical protein